MARARREPVTLVVDASFHIDGEPLVLQQVYYPTLLGAYLRTAGTDIKILVAAPSTIQPDIQRVLKDEGWSEPVAFVSQESPEVRDALVLRIEDVHHPRELVKHLLESSPKLPEPVWKIREAGDITRAAPTLERLDMYVLARAVVLPVARPLAKALVPTRVSPNIVTAASASCGVAAAFAAVPQEWWWGVIAALLIHASITLDFTDGFLARLRGSDSRLGYWFDTLMDELVKISLFAGMTASAIIAGRWMDAWLGMGVLVLYHVLSMNHWLSKALEQGDVTLSKRAPVRWRPGFMGAVRRLHGRLSDLDVHLYLIAVSIAAGVEGLVMALFAVEYCLRLARLLQVRLSTGQLN